MTTTTKRPVSRKVTPAAKPIDEIKPVAPVVEKKEVRETAEEKKARLEADKAELGITGAFQDAYPHATRKAIVESIREQIASAPIVNGKQAGCCQWTVSLALGLLRLMRGKGVQRPTFSWSQIADLASAMRAAVLGDDHETKWYDGTNVAVVSIDDYGIDSRHRNMAFIVAFGTPLEIDEMLRIVRNHDEQPLDDEGNVNIDPASLLTVPITGWKMNGTDDLKIDTPTWAFIVSLNVAREAFSVIDTAQRERTGADMLATYPESSRVLAESGIDAKTMETALGEVYMRSNFTYLTVTGGPNKGQTITKPGSLKTGGKKGPNRYPVYSRLFGGTLEKDVYTPGLIAQAQAKIDEVCKRRLKECSVTTGVHFDKTPLQKLGYYHVLAVSALAIDAWDVQDGGAAIEQFVRALCETHATADGKKMPPAKKGTPALLLRKYLEGGSYNSKDVTKCFIMADGSKRPLKTAELFTAIVLAFTHASDEFALPEFLQACDKEYEYRIVGSTEDGQPYGIDCIGLDKDLVTAAEKAIYGKATQVRANKKAKK